MADGSGVLSRTWVRTADTEYNFEIHDLTESCASQSRDSNTSCVHV